MCCSKQAALSRGVWGGVRREAKPALANARRPSNAAPCAPERQRIAATGHPAHAPEKYFTALLCIRACAHAHPPSAIFFGPFRHNPAAALRRGLNVVKRREWRALRDANCACGGVALRTVCWLLHQLPSPRPALPGAAAVPRPPSLADDFLVLDSFKARCLRTVDVFYVVFEQRLATTVPCLFSLPAPRLPLLKILRLPCDETGFHELCCPLQSVTRKPRCYERGPFSAGSVRRACSVEMVRQRDYRLLVKAARAEQWTCICSRMCAPVRLAARASAAPCEIRTAPPRRSPLYPRTFSARASVRASRASTRLREGSAARRIVNIADVSLGGGASRTNHSELCQYAPCSLDMMPLPSCVLFYLSVICRVCNNNTTTQRKP
ncbi:uncharacterized protein V1518DRAFT_447136 [Limtongia smithiae]|uniref:uncharacterized protein n=1 Tax=Limtongia smithiae TaxID=1125753 RepID=UPI0034CD8AFA